MKETAVPYELPEVGNHSFFFIDQYVSPRIEAKLHRHDAWELYCVVKGHGRRMVGDTMLPFNEGEVALLPPGIHHQWEYDHADTDECGRVNYLMVAFSHTFVERCVGDFPEIHNSLSAIEYPKEAVRFGKDTSCEIRQMMTAMLKADEIGRLATMLRLLPVIFTSFDFSFVGKPVRIEKDVRRMQHIAGYVMAHYIHEITLDDISSEVGMNRSAFCSYFKRQKGMTFSQFVMQYRLKTAADLLLNSKRQVSEICYAVGFNDLLHFVRMFTKHFGLSPTKYRLVKHNQNNPL